MYKICVPWGLSARFERTLWAHALSARFERTLWAHALSARFERTLWAHANFKNTDERTSRVCKCAL